MALFDGCLLASDIDGTLFDNGHINPRNIEAIEFFVKNGGHFSLASGRGAEGVAPVVKKLGKTISPCITLNGGMIYDMQDNKVLWQKTLFEEEKSLAKTVVQKHPQIAVEVHIGATTNVINRNSESDDHENYEEILANFVTLSDVEDRVWNKVIYIPTDKEGLELMRNIEGKPETSTFVNTTALLGGRMRYYFEQLPNGISKATALRELAKILNIEKGNVFAIGDYYNDLEMICAADIGAATKESPDNIKQKAKYVTCSCADGAVADFIEYLTALKQKGY